MKKETMFATIFGVLLGLTVALILIFFLRPSGNERVKQAKSTLTPKIVKNSNLVPLVINEPSDRAISDKDSLTISGTAKKDSLLIFESAISEKILKNKNESFKLSFPLARGENLITIRAYVDRTQTVPQIKTLKVYYLNEE